MSTEIIEILDDLAQRFGIAIDWSSENVVPYLQKLFGKYINYELATSVAWRILILIGIITMVMLVKWIVHEQGNFEIDGIETILILIAIILFPILLYQVFNIIKYITFPEKLVIDELLKY